VNFLIYCVDDPAKGDADEALRSVHRDYLFGKFRDRILSGGPIFAADGKTITGRVILADFPNQAEAEAFVANELYFKAGHVKTTEIKPMRMAFPAK
jgi:uncharacterized protein YciI